MIGGDSLLALADQATLASWPGYHAINRLFQIAHANPAFIAASSQNRRFVQDVREVGTGETRRLLGQRFQSDTWLQRLALCMHLENGDAPANIRPVKHHLAIEATWTQKRGIEHIGAIGRGDDNHIGIGIKAIHLYQDLVQGLLAFVVRTSEARTALASHRVDLIYEHDAGAVALG